MAVRLVWHAGRLELVKFLKTLGLARLITSRARAARGKPKIYGGQLKPPKIQMISTEIKPGHDGEAADMYRAAYVYSQRTP